MTGSTEAVANHPLGGVPSRIDALDWQRILNDLDERGWALTGQILTQAECDAACSAFDDEALYRSHVVMARHGFGLGEYKYFAYPLPMLVNSLRRSTYPHLARLANVWAESMGLDLRYPTTLAGMTRRCRRANQTKPTPLILRYGENDYNCLHQDLYGDVVFPIQFAALLSRPGEDFLGGELVLTEQRPRRQSRAHVVNLLQGEAMVFAVSQRPVRGKRGYHRVTMRHGVSTVSKGQRYTLGVIFHDAR